MGRSGTASVLVLRRLTLLMMMVVDNSRNVNANYLVIGSIGHLSRAAIENRSLLNLDSIFSSHNKFEPVK